MSRASVHLEAPHGPCPVEGMGLALVRRTAAMLEDGATQVALCALRLVSAASGRSVAYIEWQVDTREIRGLCVDSAYQRQGVATWLYHEAATYVGAPLVHSEWRTGDGEAWAQSLGVPLPPWRVA